MPSVPLLTRQNQLEDLLPRLLDAEAVALDTEFKWERTYYPILGLLQIGVSRDECWLVDAVAVPDLSPLAPLIESTKVVKILHDALQDLTIISRYTKAKPRCVFDTRRSAGFAGLKSTTSMQALVHDTLGIDLPKTETRSDWLRRPLSPAQLAYAADDVRYLPEIRHLLIDRCPTDEIRAWLAEENGKYDDPGLYDEPSVEEAAQGRVKGASRLSPREKERVREISVWREGKARARDLTRRFVLEDELVIDIAVLRPASLQELLRIRRFPHRMPDADCKRILGALDRADAVPDSLLEQRAPYDPAEVARIKDETNRLLADIAAAATKLGIDPALVAARHDAAEYVSAPGPTFSAMREKPFAVERVAG